MGIYQYVLRRPGKPDELLVSDQSDDVTIGDRVTIRNLVWRVADVEASTDTGQAKRIILERTSKAE